MISFIGDVHGLHGRYERIQRKCCASVQLGDFGFYGSWAWIERTSVVDSAMHRILPGNHDIYPQAVTSEYSLGHYGVETLNAVEFFFVRGAHSIDKETRTRGVDWWAEEELDESQFCKAINLYCQAKPEVVVSHDCPTSVLSEFVSNKAKAVPSTTNDRLQTMLDAHKPAVWVFGHHHRTRNHKLSGVHFQCVGELQRWDLR